MYIQNWDHVPDGSRVIQDTFNEVYIVSTENGKRYLTVVGFQIQRDGWENDERLGNKVEIDFDPNCIYDQPWIRLD